MPFIRIIFVSFLLAVAVVGCTRYHSQSELESNILQQRARSIQAVAEILEQGLPADTELRLEVYFHTDRESKATRLVTALKQRGYEVTVESDPRDFFVTGQTTPVAMEESSIVKLTEDMCRTGFAHDCRFDGWATNPFAWPTLKKKS